jgi:hypothetical protein
MEEQSKREIVINSDWRTTLGVFLLLLFAFWRATYDFRHVVYGRVVTPVSINTLFLAISALWLAYWFTGGRLLRVSFLFLGIGAGVRAGTYYLRASDHAQFFAAVNALMLGIFAWTMVFIYAVQWFRGVVQIRNRQ